MNAPARNVGVAVAFLVILGAGLRLLTLPWLSFSGDETWTLRWITQPAGVIMSRFDTGLSMHLYLLGMRAWAVIAGYSELALKLPSLVAGVLTLPALYLLTRRWMNDISALAVLALAATSLPLIEFSRTARVYACLVLFGLAVMALFVVAVRRRKALSWIALGVANAITLMLSGNASYLMLAQGVVIVLEAMRDVGARKSLLVGFTSSCCLALALAALFYSAAITSALQLFGLWTGGSASRIGSLHAAAAGLHPGPMYVLLALAAIGTVLLIKDRTLEGQLLVAWAWLPLLMFALLGARQPPHAFVRFLLPILPAQLCLAGHALAFMARRSAPRHAAVVAMAFALAIPAAGYALYPDLTQRLLTEPEGIRPAVAKLVSVYKPGDLVTTYPDWFKWFFTARLSTLPRDWTTLAASCPHDDYKRLVVLAYAEAPAAGTCDKWFEVHRIGKSHYERGMQVLVSRPLVSPDDRHDALRSLLAGSLVAAEADRISVPSRNHIDQAQLNDALATLAEQAGDLEAAAAYHLAAEAHMQQALALIRQTR